MSGLAAWGAEGNQPQSVGAAHGVGGYGGGEEEDGAGWGAQEATLQTHESGSTQQHNAPGGTLTQPFVRSLFKQPQQAGPGRGGRGGRGGGHQQQQQQPAGPSPAEHAEKMQQLESEVAKVAQEKAALARMRTELEKAANKLEAERQAWERKQV